MPAAKPGLFLSYARGDDVEPFDPARSFVARLVRDLQAHGFDVWFDRVSMLSRQLTFHQEIRDAIAARERLVLVVSPRAVHSDYVQQGSRPDRVRRPRLRGAGHGNGRNGSVRFGKMRQVILRLHGGLR